MKEETSSDGLDKYGVSWMEKVPPDDTEISAVQSGGVMMTGELAEGPELGMDVVRVFGNEIVPCPDTVVSIPGPNGDVKPNGMESVLCPGLVVTRPDVNDEPGPYGPLPGGGGIVICPGIVEAGPGPNGGLEP